MTKSEISKVDKQVFFRKILGNEKIRYERKGFGLFFASLSALAFFLGMPILIENYWPSVLKWSQDNEMSYLKLYLLFGIGLHNGIHVIGNLICWFFYHFEFPFIERYKVNDLPWPWIEDPVAWRSLCLKSIFMLFFNGNVMIALAVCSAESVGLLDHFDTSVDTLADTKTLALSITFFMLVEDFAFYWLHRLLHWKVIYPWFHKFHHTHSTTVGIAGEYEHPVAFIFSNVLPTVLGPALIASKVHLTTVFCWYIIRYSENLDGHCGYDFSWSPFRLIPFSSSAEMHDFHHSANMGNYASFFSIWDTIWGTNKPFFEVMKNQRDYTGELKTHDN